MPTPLTLRVASRALALAGLLWAIAGCSRDEGGAGANVPQPAATETAVDRGDREEVTSAARAERPAPRDESPTRTAAARDAQPPVRLEPAVLDFGFVAPNSESTGTVRLVNTSSEPLRIVAVSPSCRCTAINDLEGTVIAPGAAAELQATLESAAAPGPRGAQVRILFENYNQVVTVPLKSEVALGVRVSPSFINAVEPRNAQGRLVVQSIDERPFRICASHGFEPRFIGFDPATDEPQNRYLLEYDIEDLRRGDNYPRYWVIETDREDAPLVDVLLRHELSMPQFNVRLKDYRLSAGVIPPGGSGVFEIRVDDRGDPIAGAMTRSVFGQLELLDQVVEEGERIVRVRLTPRAGYEGLLYLPFTLVTRNGVQQDLDVFASVRSGAGACPPATRGTAPSARTASR